MGYIIKKASSLSVEEKTVRGLDGIPDDWPIEKYPYLGTVPEGFVAISEDDFALLVANNQAAYDAWLQAKRPIIIQPDPPVTKVQIESSLGTMAVDTVADLVVTWQHLKEFYDANAESSYLQFFDLGDYYFIWLCFRNQKFYIPRLDKTEASEFEAVYKIKSNVPEAPSVRITTNRFGRRLHRRFVSFTTSNPNKTCNMNYRGEDDGYFAYSMLDAAGNPTTDCALAETTLLDFEPEWCYEIANGDIWVPTILEGSDDDYWELHVVAAPDVPEAMGGCIPFVQNPHIKWFKGKSLFIDSTLNPANLRADPAYHSNKLRFVIHHPAGAQSEFQISMGMFRCVNKRTSCSQHSKGFR